jgi:hypothetical protein
MLRWFPTLPVATACFSCSPPDLNFSDPYFIFMYMHYNHCHWATAHLQLNLLLLLLLYGVSVPCDCLPSLTCRTFTCRSPLTSSPSALPWVTGTAKGKFDGPCVVKVENQMWFMTILWGAVTILAFAWKSLKISYRTPGKTQN